MHSIVRRIVLFSLVTLLLFYIYFFVTTTIGYPEDRLLHQYKIGWIFLESLRNLIERIPSIAATAVIAALATIPGEGADLSFGGDTLVAAVSRLMVLFLVFTLLYTALGIGLLPGLYGNRHDKLYLSGLARSYRLRGETAEENGNLETAREFYRDYLSIVESDPTLERKAELLEGRLEARREEGADEEAGEPPVSRHERYRDLTAAELVEQSREALEEQEDPFTAHYLAQLALELDKTREDAKRLAARAWDAVGEMEPNRAERKAHSVYERKVRGYRALQQGNPVEAYYIFLELSREVPGDSDVQEYLEESRREARSVAFFIEEARETDTLPGSRNIVYVEPGSAEQQTLVYVDKMVRRGAEAWLHRLEMLTFTGQGELVRHLSTRYAKVSTRVSQEGESHSVFLLRGIAREGRGTEISPAVQGREMEALATIHRSSVTVAELDRMSMDRDFLARLNVIDLFKLQTTFDRYRHPETRVQQEILMRLLGPFMLLITALLSVGLGLRLRPRGRKVPVLLAPVLLVLPFASQRLITLYQYPHQILFSAVLRGAGFPAALLVLLATQAVLLFIAIYFMARYSET